MALTAGTRLGPYEIAAQIGKGGMGEVYRALDTSLGRQVAIKVLPDAFAQDANRLARFEREARLLASLNHPRIGAIYGLTESDGIRALVLELVEGPTLADRLTRGPVPIAEAVTLATQIAEALDAAHRAGIVHRDLKPANIVVTKGGIKLLDFGIARMMASAVASETASATKSATVTADGTLLGTAPYMAPEQVEGREADARSDLFAFGAVVYEMVTGERAFSGESQASVVAAVLERDPPPLATVQPLAPPLLDRVVRKCLAKNPDDRWQSARDLLEPLQWVAEGFSLAASPAASARSSRLKWIGGAAALVVVATGLGLAYLSRPAAETPAYRSTLTEPAGVRDFGYLALSPDGRQLAYVAPNTAGRNVLWVKQLDTLAARALPGTEDPNDPFWSPDGRSLAFTSRAAGGPSSSLSLKRISASGGPIVTLAEVTTAARGAWSPDDVILFTPIHSAPGGSPIYRVPASGGTPSPVTALDESRDESFHSSPSFLPDGRHFLYSANTVTLTTSLYVGSLDSPERTRLLDGVINARYAQGQLLFVRDTTLMAQPFDLRRFRLSGAATPIAERVWTVSPTRAEGEFTVSDNGVLAFQGGSYSGGGTRLTWLDRAGRKISELPDSTARLIGPNMGEVMLSPDDSRAAFSTFRSARPDLWILDVARGVPTRLTVDPAGASAPIWSADGKSIAFRSLRNGREDLYMRVADGSGTEQLLLSDEFSKIPESISPDGRHLLYYAVGPPPRHRDLWVLPLSGDRKPFPFRESVKFSEAYSHFSPDGRWIMYLSNETGRNEVYVTPFPGPGGKTQVSTAGGAQPRWRRDGKEIFYLSGLSLWAVRVKADGARFEVGTAQRLFDVRWAGNHPFDVTRDGQRFLVTVAVPQEKDNAITMIVNWPALVRASADGRGSDTSGR